jgi:hypothetical protein
LIRRLAVPGHALHARYLPSGAYVDCYATEVPVAWTHAEFVARFYTSWLFKLEAWLLARLVDKPSSDAEARELAQGRRESFAAWTVEARADNQLLMCDFMKRTRSWFMTEPVENGGTRLYFGSVVVPVVDRKTGRLTLGWSYSALLGFHKLYSRALLRAASGGKR